MMTTIKLLLLRYIPRVHGYRLHSIIISYVHEYKVNLMTIGFFFNFGFWESKLDF